MGGIWMMLLFERLRKHVKLWLTLVTTKVRTCIVWHCLQSSQPVPKKNHRTEDQSLNSYYRLAQKSVELGLQNLYPIKPKCHAPCQAKFCRRAMCRVGSLLVSISNWHVVVALRRFRSCNMCMSDMVPGLSLFSLLNVANIPCWVAHVKGELLNSSKVWTADFSLL